MALLLAAVLSNGCRPAVLPPPDLAAVDRLLRLMGRRLEIMHDVARWKWSTGKPIRDPQRERELLDKVAERGQSMGLDPDFTTAFFASQIEAARLVQQADFDRWVAEGRGPFADAEDLATLRGRIDALNGELSDALAEARPGLDEEAVRLALPGRAEEILGDAVQARVQEVAIAPLLKQRSP